MTEIVESNSLSGSMMDSLPYVETVHEDYEEYALALIEEEMKVIAPRPMRKIPPLNFRTPMMRTEYESLVVNGKLEDGVDAQKSFVQTRPKEQFQLFQPKKVMKPSTMQGRKDDENTILDAISQMKSRYEAERIRALLLDVDKEEGVSIWKAYNAKLDELAGFWNTLLKQEIETVEEINFRRQQSQTQQVGPEITRLNQKYQEALYRRNQLEHAIEGLKRKSARASNDEISRKRKIGVSDDEAEN